MILLLYGHGIRGVQLYFPLNISRVSGSSVRPGAALARRNPSSNMWALNPKVSTDRTPSRPESRAPRVVWTAEETERESEPGKQRMDADIAVPMWRRILTQVPPSWMLKSVMQRRVARQWRHSGAPGSHLRNVKFYITILYYYIIRTILLSCYNNYYWLLSLL